MNTDQNLLFGVLALQLEFIDAPQFIEACGVWATRKDAGLGDVLLERGWIDADAKRQVENLLARKLHKHGGDARTVLGTVADASIRDLLRSVDNDEVDATLSLLAPAVGHVRVTDEFLATGEERSHYTLSRVHDQGGLGRVWRARDRRLHREVALKEIRPESCNNPQSRQRFVREAQITGQLEHPNIVPVYEYGHDPNSRLPFYTMRFLDGQELNGAIDGYHRRLAAGQEDPLELRRLLTIFVSVCNAIAYAHSKGVIHRDLKPSNVMLGAFGEVIVLDWGLAKALHLPDQEETDSGEQASISLSVTADTEVTLDGQKVGTPAYMAPEQARGAHHEVDTRTDVYGLGAILFRILTGKRPHHGKGTQEVLSNVADGPTPEPREIDSKIHPALNAICLKAMARQRADRYQTAHELAGDIQRWLADEPVSVYREPWIDRTARWARRHRAFTQAAAVTLLIVSLVASVAAVWVNQAREAEKAAKNQALATLAQAVQTVDEMFTGVNMVLRDQPAVQPLRRRLLQLAADRYAGFVSLSSNDPKILLEHARTHLRLGNAHRMLDDSDKATQAYEQAERILQGLLADQNAGPELQSELATKCWKLGELLAEEGRRDEAFEQFDQAQQWLQSLPPSLQVTLRQTELQISRADAEQRLGDLASAETRLSDTEKELARKIDQAPNPDRSLRAELARVRSVLAGVLVQRGRSADAATILKTAIELYDGLLFECPDERSYLEGRAYAELNRAQALALLGRPAEEIEAFQRAIRDFQTVFDALTDIPHIRENLAIAHMGLGSVDNRICQNQAAIDPLDSSLRQFVRLRSIQPTLLRRSEGLAGAAIALGAALADLGNVDQATQNLQSAMVVLTSELMSRDPHCGRYPRDAGIASTYLGGIYEQQGNPDEACKEYEFAIEFLEAVIEQDPEEVYARDALAVALECWGDMHREQGNEERASAYYTQALEQRQSKSLGEIPAFEERKARLLLKFGNSERTDEAIRIAESLRAQCPDNGAFGVLLASAYLQADRGDEAIELLESIDAKKQLGAGPGRDFWLAIAYHRRGAAGDQTATRQAYDRAAEWMELEAPGNLSLRRLRNTAAHTIGLDPRESPSAADPPEIMPEDAVPR